MINYVRDAYQRDALGEMTVNNMKDAVNQAGFGFTISKRTAWKIMREDLELSW